MTFLEIAALSDQTTKVRGPGRGGREVVSSLLGLIFEAAFLLRHFRHLWTAGAVEDTLNTLTARRLSRNFCDQRCPLIRQQMAQKAKDNTQISVKGHNDVPRVGRLDWSSNSIT